MELHEECGVFGIYDPVGDCARTAYYGLYALQHRGQEACGIAAINDRELSFHKDVGLVGEVFHEGILDELNGTMAVGHVRYSTAGGLRRENAQPLTLNYVKGTLALAHNGNLPHADELRTKFEYQGAIFQTTSDSELIAYAIAQARLRCPSVEEAVQKALSGLRGAWSLIVMSPRKLVAARDPWGFRPLCMGRRGKAVMFASESCALDAVGARFERELDPGEIVAVEDGVVRTIQGPAGRGHLCIFEYIYFARPDSLVFGEDVYRCRKRMGMELAREAPTDAELVMPFPDSGVYAALGFAQEAGVPYEHAYIRNHYVGRTFIQPSQTMRDFGVRVKLNPVRSMIDGHRICMVDDSIVRGTTVRTRVRKLRELGVREAHFRVSCPPVTHPCFYGIDFSSSDELVAANHPLERLPGLLNLDSLHYLSIEGLLRSVSHPDHYCLACFDGRYPVPCGEACGGDCPAQGGDPA